MGGAGAAAASSASALNDGCQVRTRPVLGARECAPLLLQRCQHINCWLMQQCCGEGGGVGAYACYMLLLFAWLGSFVGQLLRRFCAAEGRVQEL